jgi:leucyl aminopeptidase
MTVTARTAELVVRGGPPQGVDADVLAVPVFEDDTAGALAAVDAATGREVARVREAREFTGELYDIFLTPVVAESWRPRRVALVGAGPSQAFTPERLCRLCAAVGLEARRRHITRLAFEIRGPIEAVAAVRAAAEGLTLGEYDTAAYKAEQRLGPPAVVTIVHARGSEPELREAAKRGRVLAESSNMARALANEPANVLTPSEFAARAGRLASEVGLGVEILDEHAIEALGMGLLLGVARGTAEPPRVIVLRHEPADAPASPVLGLVGKGITFDTGGISLKPADGMERMKDDMAGGAAVVCAMRAIAKLKARIRVIGIVPCAENMPGSRAIKPGDVLTSASGQTVEVVNTDAEGRLVLGDALWYARELGATHLVDVATLTGACIVALGKHRSGVFGAPDWWIAKVEAAAARAGDRVWPLPLDEEYFEQLKSEIADFSNSGGRPAGAITAATFLKQFSGGLPWVHMDIAGTAWLDEAKPYQPKGPSGVAVRTLAELALGL